MSQPHFLSRKEVVAELRRRAVRGEMPAFRELPPAVYEWLLRHFGSTVNAARAAGLTIPDRRPRKWSREKIVRGLKRLDRKGQRIVTADLLCAGHHDIVTASRKYFGSLPRARKTAGIPTPPRAWSKRTKWDEDLVIYEIRTRFRARQSIAASKVPGALYSAAERYYGSWGNAVEAAGFDYGRIRLRRTTPSARSSRACENWRGRGATFSAPSWRATPSWWPPRTASAPSMEH